MLDIHAVAERLGLNVQVRRQVTHRTIPFYKLGALLMFDIDEVNAWLDAASVRRPPSCLSWPFPAVD